MRLIAGTGTFATKTVAIQQWVQGWGLGIFQTDANCFLGLLKGSDVFLFI